MFFYNLKYVTNVQKEKFPELNNIILKKLYKLLIAYNPYILIYKTIYKRLAKALKARSSPFRVLIKLQIRVIL